MITGRKETLKGHMGEGPAPVVRLPVSEKQVTCTIDDVPVTVPQGTTILEAALASGIRVPYFCYHPGLSPEGNCRMCLVEIEGSRKLEPSCILPVRPGMAVFTHTEDVAEARRGVMEFLLLNHPLDCPWCDKAGECMLQDNSYDYGLGTARHEIIKRTYPVKDFSDHLKMYMNRCIHCTRCVRFLREVEGKEDFALYERGAQVDVGTYIEHNLSGNYQGCLADVCPVGALVTKPFLYRARVFDLEAQVSVCALCSAGCSVYVDRKENRVARLRPRPNLQVNDWWMCDVGRFEWGFIEKERLLEPMRPAPGSAAGEMVALPWEEALEEAAGILSAREDLIPQTAGVIGADATCEEAWLFGRLMAAAGGDIAIWYGPAGRIDPNEKTDFLHRSDPNPNTVGVEMVLLGTRDPVRSSDSLILSDFQELLEKVVSGEVRTLFVMGAALTPHEIARLAALSDLVVLSSHLTPAVSMATLALPGAVWLEKAGTFVNGDGHLQRFFQAIDPAGSARPEAEVLAALLHKLTGERASHEPSALFDAMAAATPGFEGLNWDAIPMEGTPLTGPEGSTP